MRSIDPTRCREVFRRLDDYLDRELTPAEIVLVERHLEVCAVCAREFRFEATVLDHVRGKVRRLSVPAGLYARVWDRIRRGGGG